MSANPTSMSRSQLREFLLVATPAIVLIAGAFWLAFQFVTPAPPKRIVMTTGAESGAYYAFGKRYAEALKAQGITLEVRTSAGSVENAKRLADESSGVDVALLQGGVADSRSLPGVMSLGRLFLEPLWIFYRAPQPLDRLSALAGARIAVGPEGSGTRVLVDQLLTASGIDASTATLLPLGGAAAADALAKGEADAVFLALAPEAPLVQKLLKAGGDTRLMSLVHAEAYTRRFPYLSMATLPKGVVDLVGDIPDAPVNMVAPQAALVARANLHPALVGLLVDAAQDIHGGGGLFHRIGDFPRPQDPDFDVSSDAERIYKSGKPFFQRYLPFWLASFIERMLVMVVPIATILLPLVKLVPLIYDWRIKRRILHWYGQLKGVERQIGAARSAEGVAALRGEIDRIEEAVGNIPMPLRYSDRYYDLRSAVDLVRQRISARG